VILAAGRRGVVQPHHADHDLNKCAQKHQQELQVQSPPLTMEARRDLGFEDQKHPVGFHEDARYAEDEADPEGRLPYAARPVLRLADEDEGAGEATD